MTLTVTSLERAGTPPVLLTEDVSVSFVVEVLVADGLRVPPFTYHEQHVGQLQSLGLTAEIGERWLSLTIAQFEDVYDAVLERASLIGEQPLRPERPLDRGGNRDWEKARERVGRAATRKVAASARDLREPARFLSAMPELASRIQSEWKRFLRRQRSTRGRQPGWAADADSIVKALGRGRPWRVLFVSYPSVIVHPIGKATILVTLAPAEHRMRMLDTLADLTRSGP